MHHKTCITKNELNDLIKLHNSAFDDYVYGERLLTYCRHLYKANKLEYNMIQYVYILSILWPQDSIIPEETVGLPEV